MFNASHRVLGVPKKGEPRSVPMRSYRFECQSERGNLYAPQAFQHHAIVRVGRTGRNNAYVPVEGTERRHIASGYDARQPRQNGRSLTAQIVWSRALFRALGGPIPAVLPVRRMNRDGPVIVAC